MSNCRIYIVKDGSYDDFDDPVEPSRLVLYARHWHENGREVACELYDGEGKVISRNEISYNELGLEIENCEFVDNSAVAFKITRKTYNAAGSVSALRTFFDGEQATEVLYEYDNLGRTTRVADTDEDGVEQVVLSSYEGENSRSIKDIYWAKGNCWKEVNFRFEQDNDGYGLTEEYLDNKLQPFDSYVRKLYTLGEVPNNVTEETYNTDGDLLEECRETVDETGTLQKAYFTDDHPGSTPFAVHSFRYNEKGLLTFEEYSRHGIIVKLQRLKYDDKDRKVIEHEYMNSDVVLIYKYED